MIREINSFGDARRFILETMLDLRDDKIPVDKAIAIAANMKVLNENIYAEIKSVRLAIDAKNSGHEFGRVVEIGKLLIGNE